MIDAPTRTPWFYRQGGVVTQTAEVADPAPMIRANAYAKSWRCEELTADERAALASADAARPFVGFVGNQAAGAEVLGLIAVHRPEVLQALDRLAEELAALGMMQLSAWSFLTDYCRAATTATLDDCGLLAPAEPNATPPADGPEGWSKVPPISAMEGSAQ